MQTKALVDSVLLHASSLVRLELTGMLISGSDHCDQLVGLSALTKLTHLEMRYMNAGSDYADDVLRSLSTLTDLRHLGVGKSYAGDPSSIPLAHMPHLTSLDISYCASDKYIHKLADCLRLSPLLESLDISGNIIGPEHAASVACVLPDLPRLALLYASCNGLGVQGVVFLLMAASRHPSLRLMDLKDNRVRKIHCIEEVVSRFMPKSCRVEF